MKKLKVLILTLIIVLPIVVGSAVLALESEKIQLENQVEYAEGFLREYYQTEYVDVAAVGKYDVNEGLKEYLGYKSEAVKANRDVYGKIRDYKLKLERVASERIGEDVLVDIIAHIEFKYPGSDEVTKIGERVSVVVGKEGSSYIIEDFYSSGNYFDRVVRGENIVLFETDSSGAKRIKTTDFAKIADKAEKQNELLKKAAESISKALADSFEESAIEETSIRGAAQTDCIFDVDATRIYANSNAIKQYPAPGSALAPNYMDMGIYGGDCTNFISHCLLAGGSIMNTGSNDATHWYYLGSGNRSATWSSVRWFHDYINNTQMLKGPNGAVSDHFTTQESFYDVPGRLVVIQVKYPGATNWGHSTIQVSKHKTSQEAPTMMPRITSRSAYGNYNVAEMLSAAYPYDYFDINSPDYCRFRTLQINGYNL